MFSIVPSHKEQFLHVSITFVCTYTLHTRKNNS